MVAFVRFFTTSSRLHPIWKTGHSLLIFNEAEPGSLSLRLMISPCKASCRGLLQFLTLARLP
jgi:hypothetical protein